MAACDELPVKYEVARRPRGKGGADDAHRGLGYRQREETERQQSESVEGYPLAHAEDGEPREERAP